MAMHLEALPGPDDITRRELPNGIVVLVRENFNARSVVITGSLDSGGLFDPADAPGLASFTASTLLRGTQQRDFATIHELLEGSGASLGISSGIHTVGFSGKSLGEDLPLLVDLLADALRCPAFPEKQLERLRGEIVTAIKLREQDTRYVAGRSFRQLAYPGHPYSRSTEGTVESIMGIPHAQIVNFHERYFGPRGMVIVVVGAVSSAEAIHEIEQRLGDWHNSDQPPLPELPPLAPLEGVRAETVVMPGKSQADIVLGVPGPSRLDADWQAANLANNILGVFGMYGRIGAEVREKRGMAYYSYSRLDGGLGPGAWRVAAGVNPANVGAAVEAILGEIRRITHEPVSAEELEDNKANFTGRLPLSLETNEGVAGSILMMERYRLGLDYLRQYTAMIQAITAEDLLAAAQRYLSDESYALAVAGPSPDA